VQSQAVRDALPQLKSLGVTAVGISPDTSAVQKKFDDKHQLGFPLLSDADHRITEAYGVWADKKMYGKTFMGVNRSAFLIDGNAVILAAFYKISPNETLPKLLAALGSS